MSNVYLPLPLDWYAVSEELLVSPLVRKSAASREALSEESDVSADVLKVAETFAVAVSEDSVVSAVVRE